MPHLTTILHLILAALFAFVTANPSYSTCPFPITVPAIAGCNGCIKTAYLSTSTKSIDCKRCNSVVTKTSTWEFEPVCRRYVCPGGPKTTMAGAGVATTVTSCLSTPTM